MSSLNYLSVIERYREHRAGLQDLLASILGGIATPELIGNSAALRETMLHQCQACSLADCWARERLAAT